MKQFRKTSKILCLPVYVCTVCLFGQAQEEDAVFTNITRLWAIGLSNHEDAPFLPVRGRLLFPISRSDCGWAVKALSCRGGGGWLVLVVA